MMLRWEVSGGNGSSGWLGEAGVTRKRQGRRKKGIVCRGRGLRRERSWFFLAGRSCLLFVDFLTYEEWAVDAIARMSGRQ